MTLAGILRCTCWVKSQKCLKREKNMSDMCRLNLAKHPKRSDQIEEGNTLQKDCKPPERLVEVMNKATTLEREPRSYKEAVSGKQAEQWRIAMDKEIESLKQNGTWILTELPENKIVIGSKWVYKVKMNEKGNFTRYKARLVAQGYSQKYGEDYDEVFAPVAKPTTLRTILTIAGLKGMIVKHYDVETAYLNADLSHKVYMKQPAGYPEGQHKIVCKTQKNVFSETRS